MMVSGLLPWFSLMAAGLVASVALLVWGYRSGQFADQERAGTFRSGTKRPSPPRRKSGAAVRGGLCPCRAHGGLGIMPSP